MASSSGFQTAGIFDNDWQFCDNVESATWERPGNPDPTQVTGLKAQWGEFSTPDLQALAAGLGLSSEAAAVVVWQPEPNNQPFKPASGHILRRDDKGGEGWVIAGFTQYRFGNWACACEREVVNG